MGTDLWQVQPEHTGKEVVQLYVQDAHSSVQKPVRQLKGFQKVGLQPGAARTPAFALTGDDLA